MEESCGYSSAAEGDHMLSRVDAIPACDTHTHTHTQLHTTTANTRA